MKRPAEFFPVQVRAGYRVARTGLQKAFGREFPDLYHDAHHERRAVFVHVPKTAGNSVNETVFGLSSMDLSGHARAVEYRDSSLLAFTRYFIFTFVRNPFARLYSAYRFLAGGGMVEQDREYANRFVLPEKTFGGFVRRLAADPDARDYWHVRPQHVFACDEFGRVIVDKVGRVETFDDDMRDICGRVGVRYRPRWENRSRIGGAPLTDVYDAGTEAAALSIYRDDFEIFGYPQTVGDAEARPSAA